MTIDISNLSPEKRVFLRAFPAFLKGLETTIPKEVQKTYRKTARRFKGVSKLQRDLLKMNMSLSKVLQGANQLHQEHRILMDPHLSSIDRNVRRTLLVETNREDLVCPVCGKGEDESMHGNKGPKGKPWCMRGCNAPLIPKSKLKRWKKLFPQVKRASPNLRDELRRINPGLNPNNKDVKK